MDMPVDWPEACRPTRWDLVKDLARIRSECHHRLVMSLLIEGIGRL